MIVAGRGTSASSALWPTLQLPAEAHNTGGYYLAHGKGQAFVVGEP
jgi:hypothetical protein